MNFYCCVGIQWKDVNQIWYLIIIVFSRDNQSRTIMIIIGTTTVIISVLILVLIKLLISVLTTAWKVSVFGVFLVYIFPHLDWIRKNTPYISAFSPNAGKHEPEKLRIRTIFTQWIWWYSSPFFFFFIIFFSSIVSQFVSFDCFRSLSNIKRRILIDWNFFLVVMFGILCLYCLVYW